MYLFVWIYIDDDSNLTMSIAGISKQFAINHRWSSSDTQTIRILAILTMTLSLYACSVSESKWNCVICYLSVLWACMSPCVSVCLYWNGAGRSESRELLCMASHVPLHMHYVRVRVWVWLRQNLQSYFVSSFIVVQCRPWNHKSISCRNKLLINRIAVAKAVAVRWVIFICYYYIRV